MPRAAFSTQERLQGVCAPYVQDFRDDVVRYKTYFSNYSPSFRSYDPQSLALHVDLMFKTRSNGRFLHVLRVRFHPLFPSWPPSLAFVGGPDLEPAKEYWPKATNHLFPGYDGFVCIGASLEAWTHHESMKHTGWREKDRLIEILFQLDALRYIP